MISQGVNLATKGRVVNSAVAYSTLGKIWSGIASIESAYTFVRSLILKSFAQSSVDVSAVRSFILKSFAQSSVDVSVVRSKSIESVIRELQEVSVVRKA